MNQPKFLGVAYAYIVLIKNITVILCLWSRLLRLLEKAIDFIVLCGILFHLSHHTSPNVLLLLNSGRLFGHGSTRLNRRSITYALSTHTHSWVFFLIRYSPRAYIVTPIRVSYWFWLIVNFRVIKLIHTLLL